MSEPNSALTCDDNGEADGINATVTSPISWNGQPERGKRYLLPARQGRAVRVNEGQYLKVINTYGTQVCDLWAFQAHSLQEFLSMEHIRTHVSRIKLKAGDALVTNHRRPILTIVDDTSPGIHDTLIASCDIYRYHTLGIEGYHDNCADNLRLAMKAIQLHVSEVPSPLNLWMNTPVAPDGTIAWLPTVSKAEDYIVFRAELDCVVVMSACPQDLVPINGKDCIPRDLHFEVS